MPGAYLAKWGEHVHFQGALSIIGRLGILDRDCTWAEIDNDFRVREFKD